MGISRCPLLLFRLADNTLSDCNIGDNCNNRGSGLILAVNEIIDVETVRAC